MAEINNGSIDHNIDFESSINATQDEGFLNRPHLSENLNESANTATSGVAGIWSRGVDMAKPYVDKAKPYVDMAKPYVSNVRTQVSENPWIGVGVAAGVFLTLGYLLGRRNRSSSNLIAGNNDFYSPSYAPNFATRSSADFYGSTEAGMSNTVGARSSYGSSDRIASENLTQSPTY